MVADADNIVARLETVATWLRGRQKRHVEAIIADLDPARAPVEAPVPTKLPGEGTGRPGDPPAPPG